MKTTSNPVWLNLDLRQVLPVKVLSQQLLPPSHPGQANYVWRVVTDSEVIYVKSPRELSPPDEDYWQGVLRLFEANLTIPRRVSTINGWLAQHAHYAVPGVLAALWHAGRPFTLFSESKGDPLRSFNDLSREGIAEFGSFIAKLHQCRYQSFGGPFVLDGSPGGQPIDQFVGRLKSTMAYLHRRYYANDRELSHWHKELSHALDNLPPFSAGVPILMDMDPSQFLSQQGRITAIVDTELYVVGPPQLELVALEYLLDDINSQIFQQAYCQVAPWPQIASYRTVLRAYLRLISFQGPMPWDEWMAYPTRWSP